jgi:hypothetical protein
LARHAGMPILACGSIAGSATVEPVAEPDLVLKGTLLVQRSGRASLLKSSIPKSGGLSYTMEGDALDVQLHVQVCPTHGV